MKTKKTKGVREEIETKIMDLVVKACAMSQDNLQTEVVTLVTYTMKESQKLLISPMEDIINTIEMDGYTMNRISALIEQINAGPLKDYKPNV